MFTQTRLNRVPNDERKVILHVYRKRLFVSFLLAHLLQLLRKTKIQTKWDKQKTKPKLFSFRNHFSIFFFPLSFDSIARLKHGSVITATGAHSSAYSQKPSIIRQYAFERNVDAPIWSFRHRNGRTFYFLFFFFSSFSSYSSYSPPITLLLLFFSFFVFSLYFSFHYFHGSIRFVDVFIRSIDDERERPSTRSFRFTERQRVGERQRDRKEKKRSLKNKSSDARMFHFDIRERNTMYKRLENSLTRVYR